jgi:hypothetical protein
MSPTIMLPNASETIPIIIPIMRPVTKPSGTNGGTGRTRDCGMASNLSREAFIAADAPDPAWLGSMGGHWVDRLGSI